MITYLVLIYYIIESFLSIILCKYREGFLMLNVGEYVFSSFIVRINQKIDLESSANWSDETKAIVAHEFLHFYQNCATTYGQMCIKHYGDVIASIATTPTKEIQIPINPQDYLEIPQMWHQIRYCPEQDWESVNMVLDCSIKNVDESLLDAIRKSSFLTLRQQVPKKPVVKVALNCKGVKDYILDGTALCESMVAMIEEKIFPKKVSYRSQFPYCVAKVIAKHFRPKINWDNDSLILLCSLCLDYYDPGVMFLKFFEDVDSNKEEVDARFIINYFKNIHIEIFTEINDQINSMTRQNFRNMVLENTLNSLDNLVTNKFYQPAIDWFKNGLKIFYVIRNQLLWLEDMFSAYFPYDWNWLTLMLSAEYPIYKVEPDTIEKQPEFFILGNNYLSDSVQWRYLDGLIRFLNFLTIEDRKGIFCPFYTFCMSTERESCSSNPLKLYSSKNCEFQHFMSIFNLEDKQLIDSNGNMIRQSIERLE